MKKRKGVKITEQGNRIILTFDPLMAQKSVRNFDSAGSAPKVHKARKGKDSYTRKEKHKNRDCEKNTSLCFL